MDPVEYCLHLSKNLFSLIIPLNMVNGKRLTSEKVLPQGIDEPSASHLQTS